MIAHLNGIVAAKTVDTIDIDIGGVGFLVNVNSAAVNAARTGEKLYLYTRMIVREDAMELFGFLTKEEKDMFDKLTAVSGIGPKTALGILTALSVHDLALAIVTGDVKSLKRAPGLGPKTAQRLLLELKDKVSNDELVGESFAGGASSAVLAQGPAQEAIAALTALGYSAQEAAGAVASVKDENLDSAALIKQALRAMARIG